MFEAMLEGLESRLFLSAAPMLFNAMIKADRLVVQADLLKFQADLAAGDATLLADRIAIRKATPKGDTSLAAPFAQLKADNKMLATTLREDRLTGAAQALIDEAAVKLDIVQILKDKGNSTAETADHTKLFNDRVTVQMDLIAALNTRITTRTNAESTISADTQAIVTAADNDPAATPALNTAVATFSANRVLKLTTLTNDLATVTLARTTLMNALVAAESM